RRACPRRRAPSPSRRSLRRSSAGVDRSAPPASARRAWRTRAPGRARHTPARSRSLRRSGRSPLKSTPRLRWAMPNRVFAAYVAAALIVSPAMPAAAQSPDERTRAIVDSAAFKQAAAFIKSDQDRFVRELITLTEIPAPPFKEQTRAKTYLEMLRQVGLTDVEMDPEGNVMGVRRGTGPAGGPLLLVNAHLDTVFPEGTDVKVTRHGTRLTAPGIGDDTRALALLLALVRTMDAAAFAT